METKGNKKKTLDEIIYDTYVEMQKRTDLFWYEHDENYVPRTKEGIMELIQNEDSELYDQFVKIPKEEFPLVCELWMLYDEEYKHYFELCNLRDENADKESGFDRFCYVLYNSEGLIGKVIADTNPTETKTKRIQQNFQKEYNSTKDSRFVYYAMSAVWVILSFHEYKDKKKQLAIEYWRYALWQNYAPQEYVDILNKAKEQRQVWREAEGIVEVDAEKDTKPKVQKSKKRSTKKSNDEEEEVKDINCMIELLEFCANTAKSWQKTIAELETENDRLRAENWELKYMKDEEKDGKVDDETVKQSLLSTLLVSQLDRASKFDIGDRKTIFRFLSSVATNDMEWLSRDILKEIDKLQFNKFDLNKIVEVFSQGGISINIGQVNGGNGTQGSQLPSPEDNK